MKRYTQKSMEETTTKISKYCGLVCPYGKSIVVHELLGVRILILGDELSLSGRKSDPTESIEELLDNIICGEYNLYDPEQIYMFDTKEELLQWAVL
ncbi:MAG: hypothetical protein OMM_11540 [Candidatus Magnetoglobus multicellularis str. Araruama]|uniref:Uncharacterized protein n=1 Tax=Candidatus Magnetoglobus multicellularis str. Araruama TaxID=890399 RepID=A0A1V1NY47_9BACT|nr:MAG: hypothetical protein OMM_11540 [Candidatus Magnetoglobus multicellularis str. Araruama]